LSKISRSIADPAHALTIAAESGSAKALRGYNPQGRNQHMSGKRRKRVPMAGGFERFIRGCVVLTGGTLFGLSAGALGTLGLLTLLFGALKQDGWGAAPIWLFFMAVGGGGGLLAGFIYSIQWLRNRDAVAFGVFDWLGLLVGVAVGIVLCHLIFERYYWFMQALFLAVILPPCAIVGRVLVGKLLAKKLASRAQSTARDQRAKRTRSSN
jgi:MFS family permease